jgi:hypothetical protein
MRHIRVINHHLVNEFVDEWQYANELEKYSKI